MLDFIVEAVVIAFVIGAMMGAVVAVHLTSPKKEPKSTKTVEEVLE